MSRRDGVTPGTATDARLRFNGELFVEPAWRHAAPGRANSGEQDSWTIFEAFGVTCRPPWRWDEPQRQG